MAGRLKVLVADTEKVSARTLVEGLRDRGMEVIVASDAVHVLRMARDLRPDAIVLSEKLAGGALQTMQRLRSNVYTTDIPVVAIAADGAQAARLREAGARDCLQPSVAIDRLDESMQQHQREDLDFTQAPAQVLQAPQRMAELHETQLLDSPSDASFDRLTRLASHVLGAPTTLVSLVDRDRQFFKSQQGLAQPWAGERQTGLSHSFCQWVVSGNEPLIVADATAHPVLSSNLAVRDLGVIAYAGVPLLGRSGQPIGSFCAIDSRPRDWSEDDVDTLEDLARITRAYAVLHHAKQGEGDAAERLRITASVAGHAILGAEGILRRRDRDLDAATRADLHAIIAEQASHLTRAA